MFTLVGAWCGAFVIPLDWDKSWQVNIYILVLRYLHHYLRRLFQYKVDYVKVFVYTSTLNFIITINISNCWEKNGTNFYFYIAAVCQKLRYLMFLHYGMYYRFGQNHAAWEQSLVAV